ncbi:hypothetical protein J2X31_000250 [Flavobacterium arsenatis]|uniref:Uncharacterized protein n=1 Tax=Flavobacterium arsenatis TaxID=1484332 RepID=A0ABU1TJV0_9FLAO|nr:hypothetical protein [Flavobacterium arsenatis]MDR6966257.1 hypothetical protein [Flavobacterium arsenatis]
MNKLLSLFLLSSIGLSAQTTIIEETLGKGKPKFTYDYSFEMNKIIISEAFESSLGGGVFNKAFMCDENGNKQIIIDGEKFSSLEMSENGMDFLSIYLAKKLGPRTVAYYIDSKKYDVGEMKNFFGSFTLYEHLFTNQYQLKILDVKGKNGFDFEKDDFYLHRTDFTKKVTKSFQLKKPNIQRLKGEHLLKVKNPGCYVNLVDNNSFELITKSIKKDMTGSTMYRTIYDLEGKMLHDYSYSYELPTGGLVRCSTREGKTAISVQPNQSITKSSTYGDLGPLLDLGINEHFIDPITSDVYIYGLYMEAFPAGFYLIRFDKEGNKIWEKQYAIEDKKGLNNKRQTWQSVSLFIKNYMDDRTLSFIINGGMGDDYNHFFLLDKENGAVKKHVYKDSEPVAKGGFLTLAHSSIYEVTKLAKNRYCDINTLMVYNLNEKVKKYIDGVAAKKEIVFDSFVSSKGFWLLESDNDNYYKVTLFKE